MINSAETKEQEVLHGRNYDHSWEESSLAPALSIYSSSPDSSWNGDNFHDNALGNSIQPHQNPNTTIENSKRKRMLIVSPTTSSPSSPSATIRVSERSCEDTEEESMRKKQKTESAIDSNIKQKKECLDMNEQLKQSGAADYLISKFNFLFWMFILNVPELSFRFYIHMQLTRPFKLFKGTYKMISDCSDKRSDLAAW